MNTLHFKYVAEVAKTGSITQAAENLFMAQPNLSKAIKELEDTLGFSIFRRTSKGVVLTEKGEEFLVYAKRVLIQIGRMESLGQGTVLGGNRMSLCLPGGSYVSHAYAEFCAQVSMEQELELRVKEADFLQGATLICDGEVSFGVLRVPAEYLQYFQGFLADKDLCFQTLWQWNSVVLMNASHALAKIGEFSCDRLLDFVEITGEESALPTLPGAEPTAKGKGRTVTASNGEMLLALTGEIPNGYLWTSPLPDELLTRYGLVQRICRDAGKEFCDLLVYPKDYLLTPLDRKFIDCITLAKNRIAFSIC